MLVSNVITSVLAGLRSTLRGTRPPKPRGRGEQAKPASPGSSSALSPTPLGHTLNFLTKAAHQANLTPSELLALTDYYGLNGFPVPLTNALDALVGSIATPSDKQTPRPAGRTTVTKLLKSAEEKLAAALDPLPPALVNLAPGPEPDPAWQPWVLNPPATGVPLTPSEHAAVLEAAMYASMDLIHRSDMYDGIRTAIHRWGLRHLDLPLPDGLLPKTRQEHRNAADAVLSITLWQIVNDKDQLTHAIAGDPTFGFIGLQRMPTGGRVAEHPRYGPMASADLDWDDIVLLAAEVSNRRDEDGRSAGLLIDALLAGTWHDHFAPGQLDTLVWTLGFGLGAEHNWRLLELTRWYVNNADLTPSTLSLVGWSAHVASWHGHDNLAWRLTALHERLNERMKRHGHATTSTDFSVNPYQVELIRSGITVRSAERWRLDGNVRQAHRAITDCLNHLKRAHDAIPLTQDDPARRLNKAITIQLRQVELLIVASRLRVDGHPVSGIEGEGEAIAGTLQQLRTTLSDPDTPLDDQDLDIFRGRVADIEAELEIDRET